MPKYKTAKQLGILPEERKALIAFVEHEALGRIISVNGHAHYYDQQMADSKLDAKLNKCGTAGCVAGFVFAHAIHVQGKKELRGKRTAQAYLRASCKDGPVDPETWDAEALVPLLEELYSQGSNFKLAATREVVKGLLKKAIVKWPPHNKNTHFDFIYRG